MLILTLATALAGYGDAVNGTPDLQGRQIHLWTDAVRVDPLAFESDYLQGGCSSASFTATEQTPKAPLAHDPGLMQAAAAHNDDMVTNNWFAHDSSDGTYWADRVWSYYAGFSIGENINLGYANPRDAVLEGWMCSPPHRSSIMSATYTDFGGAWEANYGTQDFGDGGPTVPGAVRTAMHEDLGNTIAFHASFAYGAAPAFVEVVLDGVAHPMSLEWGSASQGVYGTDVPDPGAGCHEYYVRADVGGATYHYPETGSYGWGSCAFDDTAASWLAGQLPVGPPPPDAVLSTDPWVAGGQVDLVVDGATPGTTVHFVLGTAIGNGPCPGALGGLCLEVSGNTHKLGDDTADGNGVAVLPFTVPAGAGGRTLHLQGIADTGAGWVLTDIVTVQVP